MTGDEAISPVRALRALHAARRSGRASGSEGSRVELDVGPVEVLEWLSSQGRKYDNLLVLDERRSATAGVLAELLPDAHVLAPSLDDLGWAQRSEVAPSTSIPAVVQLLDHFSIERAVLVGAADAADLAIAVAGAHPDRVGALVLVNGGIGPSEERAGVTEGTGSGSRDALSGLRVPVAFLFGGPLAESMGYTPASVRATTSWLRHVDAQHVAADEHEQFEERALALVADIVEAQLAAVRARAAHPATGSHRVITPVDDAN
ncbi:MULTISPECIES: alpha/beta fold hydrolase [unclassified Pseudoclavibacter]|uniref:alpha/beta fold hydrolase n=1 Tax=unclassified Pseudoclavibacter TaxID=2615177 RepID=UPI001BA94D92|nr:alpha/beta hydrolase [Pseudoclavibacter sp. Marseille-Q4354]MBS3177398.1 alpha/beta hydrolase [Pseudoclavibacter sp. Marseille-Q4354]